MVTKDSQPGEEDREEMATDSPSVTEEAIVEPQWSLSLVSLLF